ncbi:hypothetical protein, partial [Streptomyces spororaveus]|uniref:hypothetical protein n=1 Tax=Streptomyces spororaveus TaxID=284039 RepID=UPI0031E34C88
MEEREGLLADADAEASDGDVIERFQRAGLATVWGSGCCCFPHPGVPRRVTCSPGAMVVTSWDGWIAGLLGAEAGVGDLGLAGGLQYLVQEREVV